MKRSVPWIALLALVSVPMWLRDPYLAQRLYHHRHLHHCGHEPQPAAGLYRAAQPRARRLLRNRRLHQCACRARFRCRIGWRLSRGPRAMAGLARLCPRHSRVGPVRLYCRKTLVPRSRRLFCHRHHQLCRSGAAGGTELGGTDARPAGAHLDPADDARVARPRRFRFLQQAIQLLSGARRGGAIAT